jgi:hypothetical protein
MMIPLGFRKGSALIEWQGQHRATRLCHLPGPTGQGDPGRLSWKDNPPAFSGGGADGRGLEPDRGNLWMRRPFGRMNHRGLAQCAAARATFRQGLATGGCTTFC